MLRFIFILFLSGMLSGCHDAEKPETSYSDQKKLWNESFKVIGDTTCLNGEITEPKNYLCPICVVVSQSFDVNTRLKISDAEIQIRNRTNRAIVSFEIEFMCVSQDGFSYHSHNLIYNESLNPGERKTIDAMIRNADPHINPLGPEPHIISKSVVRVEFDDGTVWKDKK